jgi:preprotein translocase subunit YajC
MSVLKGDRVRTKSGVTGEVVEIWGIARTLLRVQTSSEKFPAIVFEHDVDAILERAKEVKKRRGRG